jgi:hypothetical protein
MDTICRAIWTVDRSAVNGKFTSLIVVQGSGLIGKQNKKKRARRMAKKDIGIVRGDAASFFNRSSACF